MTNRVISKSYFMYLIKGVYILFIGVLFLSGNTMYGKTRLQYHASISIDTNKIQIGEQIELTLQLQIDKALIPKWPIISDTINKGVEVVNVFPIDTINKNSLLLLTQKLIITSFDTGYIVIKPIFFQATTKFDTVIISEKTPPMLIYVTAPVIDPEKDIADINAPLDTPFIFAETKKYVLWVLAILIVIIISIIAIGYWLKNRKPLVKEVNIAKPLIPPHRIAIQELNKLNEEKLWQQSKTKAYYSRLSDIIRIYIEGQFGFQALEQTTDEIIQRFNYQNPGEKATALLEKMLLISDLVKFAKENPIASENESIMNDAFQFIKITVSKNQNGSEIKN